LTDIGLLDPLIMVREMNRTQDGMHTASGEATRQSLLKQAQELFSRQGFDGTSVKAIADAAGVNISLISYHFGGKEGLYRACLEDFGRSRLDAARRMLRPASTPEEFRIRLDLFMDEMLGAYVDNSCACKIIQREASLNLPIAQDVFRDTFLQAMFTFVEFITESQRRGAVRADLDPQLVTMLIYGGLVHIMQSDDLSKQFLNQTITDPERRRRVRETFSRMALEGLLPKTPA
jgi:AcrR family transcriptional regulator